MRKPNFSTMKTAELEQYRAEVDSELASRTEIETKQTKIRSQMEALAKAEGFDLDDLLNLKKPTKKSKPPTKVPPKYQHPKDETLQWTGRGRQPKWITEYLSSGKKTVKSLLIKA